MDFATLDFINDVKDVVITESDVKINHRDDRVETILFDTPPKQLNNIELDFVTLHSRVVITGGKSGHAVHVHYKDSARVDCQLFPNGQTIAELQQGVLG